MEQNTFFRKIRNLRWQTSELQNITFCQSQTCWDTLYTLIFKKITQMTKSASYPSLIWLLRLSNWANFAGPKITDLVIL